jgi:hypothetical protein
MHCPYSAGKDRVYIEDKSGAAAKRGTSIHRNAEKVSKGGVSKLGSKNLNIVKDYLSFLDELYHGPTPRLEFTAHAKSVHDEAFGTFDYVDYYMQILTIVDLKTGVEVVPAFQNEQLMFGAVAVEDELGITASEYRLYIWQNGQSRVWIPEQDEIASARSKMREAAGNADCSLPVLGPWCHRCKVKECPAEKKIADDMKGLVNW